MTRLNTDLIIGLASLSITAVVYSVTRGLSPLGGVFVNYILIMLVALSLASTVVGFVKPERRQFFDSVVERNNILLGLTMLGLYLLMLPWAGFLISSYVFYFVISLYLSDNRWATGNVVKTVALSALVVTAFYFIFHGFLAVPLPMGTWFGE
ncbi:MAG: tripartite tricarboxylate transporter TctB family protein [Desulfocurvibacter africanus]